MSRLPENMRAVIVTEPGGPEVMQIGEMPLPEPAQGEVLVRVHAAGVNRPDIMQRKGLYPPPPGASPLLGLEISGEIVGLGSDIGKVLPGVALGQKICALVNGGGYAEYCVVPATQVLPLPENLDMIQAAALPETFFTVWSNLFLTAHMKAGDRILVHGGTGGIGTAAIQIARAFGADVFATAGTAEKCQACENLGAKSINYRDEDFVERIHEMTDGQGVDIILDMIGGSYCERNLKALALDGRLVIIALQGGAKADGVNLARIMTRRLHVTGTTLRPRSSEYKGDVAKSLYEKVWPLIADGEIRPLVHDVFAFDDVVGAHKLMEEGSHIGKIVLDLSSSL